MSLNSGQGPKAEMRMQLQKLIDEYQADGGSISRGRGSKTTIVCTICNSRRHAKPRLCLELWKALPSLRW